MKLLNIFAVAVLLSLFSCKETGKVVSVPDANCISLDEQCNGLDDDCDGVVDNTEFLGVKPCYDGDMNELLYGICQFGVARCMSGTWKCEGQVNPTREICNALDDNCNGEIDEFLSSGADIVFVIDYSGSMSDKITALNNIVASWTSNYAQNPDIKFALVGAPSDVLEQDKSVIVMLLLSDVVTFIEEIKKHPSTTPSGHEATLDAIYLLSDPLNPLGINWTGHAKSIFVFTDEEPQSYITPTITETMAKNMSRINNVNVFIFSLIGWRTWNNYPLSPLEELSGHIDNAISLSTCR